MLGNVWEWVSTSEAEKDAGRKFVLRGGSYLDTLDGKKNHKVRATTRMTNDDDAGSDNLGFRCALDADIDSTTLNKRKKQARGKLKKAISKAKAEAAKQEAEVAKQAGKSAAAAADSHTEL
eukprot:gb/GEZN01030861.1/.p1 GENE.gb/GEZN01030861.1/~~gb/GEZN01030861.1/.p1  ORF type:complete len:131 (+),score=34.53 gb/GEZN01030861.1/:31-393(+)